LMLLTVVNEKLLDPLLHGVDQGIEVLDLGNVVGHVECAEW